MKVLLRQNVRKLGHIGDVVDVKNGYARNYLIPQGLGTAPTDANIKAVEAAKARYLEELAKERKELEIRAAAVSGTEITIAARANEEGHLYGSVGPAQIAAALAEVDVFVNADEVILPEPIRTLDKYDVQIEFDEEIRATIHVWVVPLRGEFDEEEAAETPEDEDAPATEDVPAE
ncbi:MAG: 50S ribosomal protein L9 [Phycisphaerae bacterium]|nr:50S ribosomal protein L9 [Phycisphaerae bacterium]